MEILWKEVWNTHVGRGRIWNKVWNTHVGRGWVRRYGIHMLGVDGCGGMKGV